MQKPWPTLSACLLVGFCGLKPSVEPPPSAAMPCDSPVSLPDRALSDRDVEILWGRDRRALVECGGQVEVLSGRGA